MAEILEHHQIEIRALKDDISFGGKVYPKASSYLVPKKQKNSRLLKAMFERRTAFRDSLFYDISAWTLPLAFDLNFTDKGKMKYADESILPELSQGQVSQKSDYAYIMPWSDYYSPKALNILFQKNVRVKMALQPFSSGSRSFGYGSILVPVQNQAYSSEKIHKILEKAAQESHLVMYGLPTGVTSGPDLGSNNFRTLTKPNIALIVGPGIDAYDAGEIWHLMDTRYNIPITKLDISFLAQANLKRYNCIVLPNTYGLEDKVAQKLKSWVENGGTLVAYQNALKWLKKHKMFSMELQSKTLEAKNISFEDRLKFRGAQGIGGAIFEAKIDRSHPINFGYDSNKLALFRNTTIFIKPDKNSYNNPIQYSQNPLLSGYISKENLELIKGTIPFKVERLGRGKVIGFTDNTNFRAFWYGTNKLLMNALFFRDEF